MKTKIIYISGNEIFDMNDIRAAFEEVRVALNLDKNTVLFGVPVDNEDAGLYKETTNTTQTTETLEIIDNEPETPTPFESVEPIIEDIPTQNTEIKENESTREEEPVKKRGRPRKDTTIIQETVIETTVETVPESESAIEPEENSIPILSVLSTKEDEEVINNKEIIPEISDEIVEDTQIKNEDVEIHDDEADLEKLLSAMTPLDVNEDEEISTAVDTPITSDEDLSVDATLEQLATEFAENQDKITSENKSSARNRIGKLRNILPFKQSKHKDNGLGDLFGWAGMAANDEEFSVPGFFTNAASRK